MKEGDQLDSEFDEIVMLLVRLGQRMGLSLVPSYSAEEQAVVWPFD